MSWSEQEKNLKSKLLNYTEDVNNEELWNVLSQRKNSKRKSIVFAIVTTAIVCFLASMLMSAYLINEKNNSILSLNKKIKEQELTIKECVDKSSLISNNYNTHFNSGDLTKANIDVESKLKNKSNLIKSNIAINSLSKALNTTKNSEKFKNENTINEATLETEKDIKVGQVEFPSSLLPLDIIKHELIFIHDKLTFKTSLTKPIPQKQNFYFVTIHGGSPFTSEQNLYSENKSVHSFTPVLAYRFSLGINKKINNKVNIRGDLMYEKLVSKLQYNSSTINQINLNDTSLITIDPMGNNFVDVENVIATKITSKKGEAFNVSNTIGIDVSLVYTIKSNIRGRVGLGYNLWQHNRGINKETSIKFDSNDKMFGYKTYYMIGLDYKLSNTLYLDVIFNYTKSNYALNNTIYQRKYLMPMIGVSYWLR